MPATPMTECALHQLSGIQHVPSEKERRAAVEIGPAAAAKTALAQLAAAGISAPAITGGGTGTFRQDVLAGVHTEVQPGSYLFMDGQYAGIEGTHETFEQSLYIHTTVTSANDKTGAKCYIANERLLLKI